MNIIIKESKEAVSEYAAQLFIDTIKHKPNAILGLATGSSPIGIYQQLINSYKNKEVDFSEVTTVNLDEYIGLREDNDQSYRYFMNHQLFNHINIDLKKTHIPQGSAQDIEKEAKRYEALIDQLGGMDIQLLGVGSNGHIGFNEPAAQLTLYTHIENLKESTIKDNARFFESIDDVPTQAISMGMGSIFKAKEIVLVAFGKQKAEAIYQLTTQKLDPMWPVSFLQLHPKVTVVVDKEAAVLL